MGTATTGMVRVLLLAWRLIVAVEAEALSCWTLSGATATGLVPSVSDELAGLDADTGFALVATDGLEAEAESEAGVSDPGVLIASEGTEAEASEPGVLIARAGTEAEASETGVLIPRAGAEAEGEASEPDGPEPLLPDPAVSAGKEEEVPAASATGQTVV